MPPHVLFADDNSDIRELVKVQLDEADFRVTTADSAEQVLQLVKAERFDILVLDYWMPEGTGIDLCHQIRTFDQRTPILICSGAVTAADKETATLAGAQGYIAKPFNARDLIQVLRSTLEASSYVRSSIANAT